MVRVQLQIVPDEVYFGMNKYDCELMEMSEAGICFHLQTSHPLHFELGYKYNDIKLIEWQVIVDNSRKLEGFYVFIHHRDKQVDELGPPNSKITIRFRPTRLQTSFMGMIKRSIYVKTVSTVECVLRYLELKPGVRGIPPHITSDSDAIDGNEDDDTASISTYRTERSGSALHLEGESELFELLES